MIGSRGSDGGGAAGVAIVCAFASMWLRSRQTYSVQRSHLSVQEAFVYPSAIAAFGTPLSIMPL